MPVSGRAVAIRLLVAGAYVAASCASAPGWPDDWDGIGFVESVRDFDMARFSPHPPGYPIYVALLRVAAMIAPSPMRAAQLVAVASGVVAMAFIWEAARRVAGERAAWTASALVLTAPLTWRACSGVGSEAPALACAAACVWGLAPRGQSERGGVRLASAVLGVASGVGLGVRLSWAPLYLGALAFADRERRARSWGLAAAACIAWLVPFVAIVGPARLGALLSEHFVGHALRWGGTIATDPGGVRLGWMARDVLVDGLGAGSDALGLVISSLVVAAASQALCAWSRTRWRCWRGVALVVVPYALWIALGQNLRDQPRHALPLVAALAAGLALPCSRSRRATVLVVALSAAVGLRTLVDARARCAIPPAGEQLVELALAQPRADRLAIFGAASVRFFDAGWMARVATRRPRALVAGSLGDAQIALTRLDALPSRVWVTSELTGRDDSRWALSPVATLCRPPRIDRRSPCLAVYEWALPYLPDE